MINNPEPVLMTPPSSPRKSIEEIQEERVTEFFSVAGMPEDTPDEIANKIDEHSLFIAEEAEIISRYYGIPQLKTPGVSALSLFRQVPETAYYHRALADKKELERLASTLAATAVNAPTNN